MTFRDYDQKQSKITAGAAVLALEIADQFRAPRLSDLGWSSLLSVLFGPVKLSRRRAARLAREFYDEERKNHLGDYEDRFDISLANYFSDWFREAMEPIREAFQDPGTSGDDVALLGLRVAKEVENGGRRTILDAVDDDPEVRGWARVATGRETCAFCLMLVSRGPVYLSAESAGLATDDTTAAQLLDEGRNAALDKLMNRWHPGCDCKVVPVFDRKDWTGRDAYLKAEQLWKDTTKGYGGRDALNALRRALDKGEVSPADFAVN